MRSFTSIDAYMRSIYYKRCVTSMNIFIIQACVFCTTYTHIHSHTHVCLFNEGAPRRPMCMILFTHIINSTREASPAAISTCVRSTKAFIYATHYGWLRASPPVYSYFTTHIHIHIYYLWWSTFRLVYDAVKGEAAHVFYFMVFMVLSVCSKE